jgi:hypothetical protein
LVLAHGASNMTSQLTLLAPGQQEALSGRAFMAGMAAGFVSHGMSGAFGSGSEGLVLLLETAVQGQVERLTGALIYQQGIFDLEAIGMSLLGVGVGFATQHMMQALGERFGWVSASDTQVQESQGHQEEGAPYAPSPEDRVHEEGLLAGQGYASGHEDAGENELRRPGFYWQEESSPASDERRYTPDWLEERGMRLLPASDSRHGVQSMDGFALEDLSHLSVLGSGGSEAVNRAFGADNVDRYIREAFDRTSISPLGQSGQADTPGIGKKILNFSGRVLRDHGDKIALGIALIPPLAPAAAGAAVARGVIFVAPKVWRTVGPRVAPAGKMMLEKISFGVDKVTGVAKSKFGFFAGRRGVEGATGNIAHNRTLHETFKAGLRQNMEKPYVRDPKLKKIVDDLYRPNAKVGSGSTADAIRHELLTGNPVKGKVHFQKGGDSLRALNRWNRNNSTATSGDRAVAENLIKDLNDAMRYEQRWYLKSNV